MPCLGSTAARLNSKELTGARKRRSMLLNSRQREPYLGLTCRESYRDMVALGLYTGGAWLSSARVVRCWHPATAQPYPMLPAYGGDSEIAGVKSEEGDDVKSSCPLSQGCKHATMAGTKGCETARSRNPIKPVSVRIDLQLDFMKLESLVILISNAG